MSQARAAAPPPPPPPAATPAGTPGPAAIPATPAAPATPAEGAGTGRLTRGIPGHLRRWRILAALAILAFTALTAGQLVLGVDATRQAGADAEQVIRVQDIKVDLLRADALATNAFLVGGLEPREQRAAYDEALGAAMRTISAAARAQSADEKALSELSALVLRYGSTMEVARANNRQGLPVGAAYLRQASADLRGDGMALVDAMLDANTTRADRALANQHPFWVAIPGVLVIAGLVLLNQWLAARFHRRINVGLALAAAVVAVITTSAVTVATQQAVENSTLRRGDYADLTSHAVARSAANAAKSSESLRLIARGSGQAFEDAWIEQDRIVTDNLPADLLTAWAAYTAAHEELVASDEAGDWDRAVDIATHPAQGSSPAFAAFDGALAAEITAKSERVSTTLSAGALNPLVVALVAVLGGLGATGAAWRGLSRRLEEYL